jgi:cytochrome P450
MANELPSASLVENLRFNAAVVVPNALQGLFSRRPAAQSKATRLNVDGQAIGLLETLRRSHGPGPLWVRLVNKPALLVLTPEDIERVLGGSPDPFASDPEGKRNGMGTFQPDALTLSRGKAWENRRRFAEAVLDTGKPLHRLADRVAVVAREESGPMLLKRDTLEYDPWWQTVRRAGRRIIFGDSAAEDTGLSDTLAEMMAEGNKMPGEPSEKLPAFLDQIRKYIDRAEPGSLMSLVGDAPADDTTKVDHQITHWLFALTDTVAANAFRALALLASHPQQRTEAEQEIAVADLATGTGVGGLTHLAACLEDAMRLYPTVPMLSRETVAETQVDGTTIPAGTQLVIVNAFFHRDRERYAFADRFSPEIWKDGSTYEDWSFNHFSHGPQGCPGISLAKLLGTGMLANVLAGREVSLLHPKLDPDKPLPHMLDYFGVRIGLRTR